MKMVSVLEVCKLNDQTVKEFKGTKEYVATGGIEKDKIVSFTKVNFEDKPSRANREVEIGDILLAKMKDTDKVLLINEDNENYIYSTGFFTIKPDTNIVNTEYIYHVLKSDYFQGEKNKLAKGATQKALNNAGLKKIKIPVPSKTKQEKIVNALKNVESTLSKRQQHEALSVLKQSVYLYMFGNPVTNKKGWETKKLKDLGLLARGKSKHRPRNAPELLNGPYPLIQTGDIPKENLYIKSYNQTYSEFGLKQSKLWPKDTLCITIAANIAHTGILTFDACFPDSIVGFTPKEGISNIFISLWFSFLQSNIERNAPQSAQKNINLTILGDLDVIVPPSSLQSEFERRVKSIERQMNKLHESKSQLRSLYDTILHKAFNGELFKEDIKVSN